MNSDDPDTRELVRRAAEGDLMATQSLLDQHRSRLRRMIAVRLDPRLARRVDPSDVVQEVLIEVVQRLPDYLRSQPVQFFPWLRRIALEKLIRLRERHIGAEKRSVKHETAPDIMLSNESIAQLAERMASVESSPARLLARKEARLLVRHSLAQMEEADREVLILRFLEHLRTREVAALLGISENAAKKRQARALDRLGQLLGGLGDASP